MNKIIVLFTCGFFLFGCNSTETTTTGGGGTTPPATISSANAVSLTGVVVTQSKSGNTYASLGKTMTGVGAIKASEPVVDAVMLSEIILGHGMSALQKSPSTIAAGAVTASTMNGAVSGTATISSNTNASGFGTGSVSFSNYSDGSGITMDGSMNITSSATSVSVTFSNVKVKVVNASGNLVTLMSGSINATINGTSTTLAMNFKITVTQGANSFFFDMQNFSYAFDSGTLTESYSGTISDSMNGTITVKTTVPLVYASSAATYPSSGELVITGGAGTKAKMTVNNATDVTVSVDSNGDGNYTSPTTVPWVGL